MRNNAEEMKGGRKGGRQEWGGTRGEKQREREYICALARIGYWKVREHLTREGGGEGVRSDSRVKKTMK